MKRKQRACIDYTGKHFGRWTVVEFSDQSSRGYRKWICRCVCGNVKHVLISNLVSGFSRSCGCLNNEVRIRNGKNNKTHGLCGTYIHKAWDSMISRCTWKEIECYKNYGGRGVRVCHHLRRSPTNLLNLIGHRPDNTFSVDRIDTNGHYSCGQCSQCRLQQWPMNLRWATPKQQCRNKTNNVFVTVDGETKCIAEWSEMSGLSRATLHQRYKRGEIGPLFLIPLHEHHHIYL